MTLSRADLSRLQKMERRNRARARKMGSAAEFVDVGKLWNDGLCGCGCGEIMDPSRLWPDPLSITIGHAIGLAGGGPGHVKGNVRLELLKCNLANGQEVETPRAAKTKRMKRAHEEGRSRAAKGRGFPGHRKFDGTPVFRERRP